MPKNKIPTKSLL